MKKPTVLFCSLLALSVSSCILLCALLALTVPSCRKHEPSASKTPTSANPDASAGDKEKKFLEFQAKAEQGDAIAQYKLGRCYLKGEGVAKDEVEAAKLYRIAADGGHIFAQDHLGVCYGQGQGVAKDEVEAMKWFYKAGDKGDVFAQYDLGRCYAEGLGVAKDDVEAYKWYLLAAGGKGEAKAGANKVKGMMSAVQIAEGEQRAASSASFGPVIERVINHPGDGTTNFFLDLDSGRFIEAPGDVFSQLKDRFNGVVKRGRPDESIGWAQANGADLMIGKTTTKVTRVLYGGLISFPVHSFTNTDAQKVLRIATEAAQHGASRPPVSISNRPGLEGDAAVFFETREGGIGLLQIVGTTDNPRSVKIRYKLLVSDFPKTVIQNRNSASSSQAFLQETPAPPPPADPTVAHPKAAVPGDVTTRPEPARPPAPTKAK